MHHEIVIVNDGFENVIKQLLEFFPVETVADVYLKGGGRAEPPACHPLLFMQMSWLLSSSSSPPLSPESLFRGMLWQIK